MSTEVEHEAEHVPPHEPRKRRTTPLRELIGGKVEDYDRMNAAKGLPSVAEAEDRQARLLIGALRMGTLRQGKRYSRTQVEQFADRFGLEPERDFVAETVDLDALDYRDVAALLSPSQKRARETGCPQTGRTLRYVTAYRLAPSFDLPDRSW